PLPLDASSTLSSMAGAAPAMSLKRRLLAYLSLTKPRLATLIVLTTTASYSLYPVPSLLSVSATQTPSLSTLTLLFLTTGTFSVVASANTLNMLLEPAHDAKMSRTRNRPLVRGLIRPRGAILFAIATAIAGTSILWYGVNPTTAALGATNIVLYAFVYTPMKRLSIANTWVGAVVGAIPPLMGWTAAGGHYLTAPTRPDTSAWEQLRAEAAALLLSPQASGGYLLAALLFAWQFPHFNALSHPIRHEYAAAGYKMAVSLAPRLNARVALRYAILMFPICAGLSAVGVTDRGFLVTSSVVNGWMAREAWRFWRTGGGESKEAAKAARGLFWASVWHLPLVLVFAMAQKKGLWESVWRGIVGEEDDEWEEV
ncbi:protoheme IX farnesyltransferase, partial [Myriangium duriaei CBS 260.36]